MVSCNYHPNKIIQVRNRLRFKLLVIQLLVLVFEKCTIVGIRLRCCVKWEVENYCLILVWPENITHFLIFRF